MKRTFFGYYRPTEDGFRALWENALFIPDANVLLNLHRYPKEVSDDLLGVLERISDRLWIPHQAALEYQENRSATIAEQVRKFGEVRDVVEEVQGNLRTGLEGLQLGKRHAYIEPDKLLTDIDGIFSRFLDELERLKQKQPNVHEEDRLRDRIDSLFEGKVGPPPGSQQDLDNIYKEGEVRYKYRRPPGYMDAAKSKNDDLKAHHWGDLAIRAEYGDLIPWKQIISEAHKRKQLRHVIFITDAEKEDWWWVVDSSGKKTLGPRPELVKELASKADIELFYMYNSERFLHFAQQYLNISVKQESVDQVRDLAQVTDDTERWFSSPESPSISQLEYSSERAVLEWLTSRYPSRVINVPRSAFPDFEVINADGARLGYEIVLVRSRRTTARRLQDRIFRASHEIDRRTFSSVNLVVVTDSESDVEDIKQPFVSQRVRLPTNISATIGMLVRYGKGDAEHYKFRALIEHGSL